MNRSERAQQWARSHRFGMTIGLLVALLFIAYLAPDIFLSIHSGEAGVMWRRFAGGTDMRYVYLEGLQVKLPWNVMYIYDVRYQKADVQLDVLSRDGLRIEVAATVRYHPVLRQLGRLHRRVGPRYLDTIVLPELKAVLGEVIAGYRPEDLYSLRREAIQRAIARATFNEGRERWVEVDDVLIRGIKLPATVQRAIQSKLAQEQLAQEYDYRLLKERKEAERKTLEARGIASFQQIVTGGISEKYLKWKGIDATLELARSPNAKVVVIGAGSDGMPIILGGLDTSSPAAAPSPVRPAPPPR